MSDKIIGVVEFWAQLNGTDPVKTGEYDLYEDDLEGSTVEDFLQNAGSDWAYEAVHSDNLNYWAVMKSEEI